MSKSKTGFTAIQNLYVMQFDLQRYLQSDLADPEARKEAKKVVDDFTAELKKADGDYTGEPEILDDLKAMRDEVAAKISKARKTKKKKAA